MTGAEAIYAPHTAIKTEISTGHHLDLLKASFKSRKMHCLLEGEINSLKTIVRSSFLGANSLLKLSFELSDL